jgi:SUMO ligase MMS21 Smc5/6 complex component
MERRVDLADQRDQCYLYAEVLHGLTELAGRQVAASQLDEATSTLREMDMVASKLQSASARDAKRLKGVEQLLEHTTHRFQDVVRSVSSDDRAAMQKTLQRLDALHSQVLAKVFAR